MITTSPTTEELSQEELIAEVRRLDTFVDWVRVWLELHYPSESGPERILLKASDAHRHRIVA